MQFNTPATVSGELAHLDVFTRSETVVLDPASLLAALAQVPDFRKKRGIRYPLPQLLCAVVCAMLCNEDSLTEISDWITHTGLTLFTNFKAGPSIATLHRVLSRVDSSLLDRITTTWIRTAGGTANNHVATVSSKTVLSFDGKDIHGAKNGRGKRVFLLALYEHRTGTVVAQESVGEKTNEIPHVAPLLAQYGNLTGTVIIADALHTQRTHADLIVGAGADFAFTAKHNQKRVRQHAEEHFRARHTPDSTSTEHLHGRRTIRSITVLPARADFPFPHVKQIARITRDHYYDDETKNTRETVFVITSLGITDITAADLATLIRGHWGIENGLHWVRDVTFGEDKSQIRTGNAPHAMAVLRNLTIGLLRHNSDTPNIAQARRNNQYHPDRAYKLLNP